MPADSPLVEPHALESQVRAIVTEVLVAPVDRVTLDSLLVPDLGAESIDFLDLIFHLEDLLGRRIPSSRWQQYVQERFGDADPQQVLTVRVFLEFAEREAMRREPELQS